MQFFKKNIGNLCFYTAWGCGFLEKRLVKEFDDSEAPPRTSKPKPENLMKLKEPPSNSSMNPDVVIRDAQNRRKASIEKNLKTNTINLEQKINLVRQEMGYLLPVNPQVLTSVINAEEVLKQAKELIPPQGTPQAITQELIQRDIFLGKEVLWKNFGTINGAELNKLSIQVNPDGTVAAFKDGNGLTKVDGVLGFFLEKGSLPYPYDEVKELLQTAAGIKKENIPKDEFKTKAEITTPIVKNISDLSAILTKKQELRTAYKNSVFPGMNWSNTQENNGEFCEYLENGYTFQVILKNNGSTTVFVKKSSDEDRSYKGLVSENAKIMLNGTDDASIVNLSHAKACIQEFLKNSGILSEVKEALTEETLLERQVRIATRLGIKPDKIKEVISELQKLNLHSDDNIQILQVINSTKIINTNRNSSIILRNTHFKEFSPLLIAIPEETKVITSELQALLP